MKNYDNLTEISIETNKGKTVAEYYANSIPRIKDSIKLDSETYFVYDVIHNLVKMNADTIDDYVSIKVQLITNA